MTARFYHKKPNQQCGFTLLEVLIALAIFGGTVAFLLSSVNSQQRAQVDIQYRTIAHWVAQNRISELRLEKNWPSVGTKRGEAEMANHKWYWTQIVTKTTEKDLRQAEIKIFFLQDDKNPTTRLVAFFKKQQAGARQ